MEHATFPWDEEPLQIAISLGDSAGTRRLAETLVARVHANQSNVRLGERGGTEWWKGSWPMMASIRMSASLMPNQKPCDTGSTQHTFDSASAIIVFVCLECLVAVQALAAYHDHFLTVSEMQQRGVGQGLPFVWHFAMWGDVIIISSLAAYLVGRHSLGWVARSVLVSFAIGFASAAILSWSYTFSGMPEAHVQNHRLTIAGIVHLVYMAIALAVFIQFFFFTKDIPARRLRAVSLLLFVHVCVGTHMALGIWTLITPLNWYPAQPLKSIPGWTIVAAVAVGSIWRNVGTAAIVAAPRNFARYAFVAIKWWLNLNPGPSLGYIEVLDYFCGFVSVLFFGKLFLSGFKQSGMSLSLFLLLLIGSIYYLSRLSVKQELKIVKSLFPQDRFPDEFQLKDRIAITLQVTLFMALYLALGWAVRNILIASSFMVVIGCIDLNTRRLINEKMGRYFADAAYAPSPNEHAYHDIQNARSVLTWYLFELPQFRKEMLRVVGCAIALGVAAYGNYSSDKRLDAAAYVILIATLVLNEVVTVRWRFIRDGRLGLL
jgi:hypothetical protein